MQVLGLAATLRAAGQPGRAIDRIPEENRARDTAAGLVLHPEEKTAELQALASNLNSLGSYSREELLTGLETARGSWTQRADSPERSRALARLEEDRARLEGLPSGELQGITGSLVATSVERQKKCSTLSKIGIGVALASFLGAMAGISPLVGAACLAVGVGGVVTAAVAAVKGHRTPERGTLIRLGTYGVLAAQQRAEATQREQIRGEVQNLVDALGHQTATNGIAQTPDGLQVGGVFLPRRRPPEAQGSTLAQA